MDQVTLLTKKEYEGQIRDLETKIRKHFKVTKKRLKLSKEREELIHKLLALPIDKRFMRYTRLAQH